MFLSRAGAPSLWLAAVALASVTVTGQSRAPQAPALPGAVVAKAFAAKQMMPGFVPPRTPWGDPDLQGNFTTRNEANTPLEKPDAFQGRRMEDITREEMAKIIAERQALAFDNTLFAFGGRAEGIAIGVPVHWMDHLDAKNSRPWFIIDPDDAKVPRQSAAADRRAAAVVAARKGRGPADSYTDRNLHDRCVNWQPNGAAVMLPTIYGNSHQILQTRTHVVIRHEMVHEARIIPLDGRPHIPAGNESFYGDARGHFDGNTLVVVTTRFNTRENFRNTGPQFRTIERFTRTAPDRIEWTVTLEDPDTWDRPWTYSLPLTADDTEMIIEYACHEGNYSLRNILTAQRSDEAKGIQVQPGAESERLREGQER